MWPRLFGFGLWRTALAWVLLCLCAVVLWLAPGAAKAQVAGAFNAAYRPLLLRAAHTHWGLDAPVATLAAQVQQESGWQPGAVSRVGARGLAQFMPATAAWWCQMHGLSGADCQPHNPRWALNALVGYDKWLWDRLAVAGAEPDRLWATLRAYNGGLGHWQAEARLAAGPARAQVDAACGLARRARLHCAENLGYPARIAALEPRYLAWGRAGLGPQN